MFSSHSSTNAHLSTWPNAARWPSVLRGVDGGKRRRRGGRCKWEGNNNWVAVKLKARVQKRTEDEMRTESVSPPRLSVHVNRKVDKNSPLAWRMLCKRAWKRSRYKRWTLDRKNLGRIRGGKKLATSEWRILPVPQLVMNPVSHLILTPNYCTLG